MPAALFRSVVMGLVLAVAAGAGAGAGVWLDVPFHRQEKNGCGAAVLAMVMEYWKSPAEAADPRAIQQALYSEKEQGIPASAMEAYLRDAGFRTFAFAGEWSDLEQHLQKGRPLIVALRAGRDAQAHYVVVAGLDAARGLVYLNDPARGKLRRVARAPFDREWKTASRWTLLAVPEEKP